MVWFHKSEFRHTVFHDILSWVIREKRFNFKGLFDPRRLIYVGFILENMRNDVTVDAYFYITY